MRLLVTMAIKDLRLLWRDRVGLFWVLAFPMLMALFFGSIFSTGGSTARSLKVAVVPQNEASEAYYEQLGKSDVLVLKPMPLDSAELMVRTGKLVAYVHYIDTASGSIGLFSESTPTIKVGIDPSRRAEAGYLNGLINYAYFSQLQQSMTDPSRMRQRIAESRMSIDTSGGVPGSEQSEYIGMLDQIDRFMAVLEKSKSTSSEDTTASTADHSPFGQPDIEFASVAETSNRPRSSWEITFPQALQWALIAVCASFALSIVTERTRGTYLRLRLAPLSRAHVLGGKATACFFACVSVSVLLMGIGVLVLGVRVSSVAGLAVAIGASGVCFVGLMMLISVLGKTEQAVSGASWALLLVFSMIGGGMVPLVMLPSWMQTVSHISPVKWSVLAIEGAIWRGFSPSDMALPVGVLIGIGLVCFAIGTVVLSRQDS